MQCLLLSKSRAFGGAQQALLLAAVASLAVCRAMEAPAKPAEATPTQAQPAAKSVKAEKAEKAGKKAAREKVPEGLTPLSSLLINPPLPDEEKALHDLLVTAIKTPAETGAQAAMKGKSPTDLSVRVAAMLALERYLPLQIAAHETEVLRHALDEAKAAFLPVFTISGGYNQTDYNQRVQPTSPEDKILKRQRTKGMAPIPGGAPLNDPRPFPTEMDFLNTPAGPNEIVFVKPGDTSHYYMVDAGSGTIQEYPSTPPPPYFSANPTTVLSGGTHKAFHAFMEKNNLKLGYVDPTGIAKPLPTSWNWDVASPATPTDQKPQLSLSIFQQLPWGPQRQITTSPVYHQAYDSYGDTFNRPWFSSFTGSMFLPLPGTKNFGPYAPPDATIKVAKQQREQALWDFKGQINAILREADARYLALVNSVMNVDAAINNRKSVEALKKQTDELFGRRAARRSSARTRLIPNCCA